MATFGIIQILFMMCAGYGIFAIIAVSIFRNNSKKEVLAGFQASNHQGQQNDSLKSKAMRGKTFSQMASFILSCALIVVALYCLIVRSVTFFFFESIDKTVPMELNNIFNTSIILIGFGLILMIPVVIIVNGFWIYNPKLRRAETEAILSGEGAFVRVQRILSMIAWVVYTLAAVIIVLFTFASYVETAVGI